MDFISIDVETANADMASICQIGIAKYSDGKLIDEWSSLINPEDYFHFINIEIHGISEEDVQDSPTFIDIFETLDKHLSETICVSHTHFDRVSIHRAVEKYNLTDINTTWLDSAMVARRTWEDVAVRGYGLSNLCNKIGYEFKHHDALEDAKAAGQVLLTAIDKSGLDLSGWLKRVKQPIGADGHSKIAKDGREKKVS